MVMLKPCPFCGSDAILEDLGGAGTCGRYFIRCPKCKVAQDSLLATKQTAIKRWNKRVTIEPVMRCIDCAYLYERDLGQWRCDAFEKDCKEIKECPYVTKEKNDEIN